MLFTVAPKIEDATLKAITDLEKEMGKTFLACSSSELKPSALSAAEIGKIEGIEKKLGVSLIAVDN